MPCRALSRILAMTQPGLNPAERPSVRGSREPSSGGRTVSMQSLATPALSLTPPHRSSLAHIPGDEGWPLVGNTLKVLADPKGHVERMAAKYGPVYRTPHVRRDQHRAARARGQRARAVRPGQAVLLDPRLGHDPRPAVSARPDAAGFRRASAAPPRAVGRLQGRPDEILPCRSSTSASPRASRSGRRAGARCCSIPR